MNEQLRKAIEAHAATLTLHIGEAPIELTRIAPGEFIMGSPDDGSGHAANETPARRIRISKAYYLGRYEITRGQYRTVMGSQPGTSGDDTLPVSDIRYADALAFCRRLSALVGIRVELPSEAQWEYACRAGTQPPHCDSAADLAEVAWYRDNSAEGPHDIGLKRANAWGLHDMLGNVWEFCADYIEDYASMADADPLGRVTPRHGAIRGGGWTHGAQDARAAIRWLSDDMFGGAGFRIAVNPDAAL